MRTVGVHKAKTHLLRLLDDVAHGETITITRHGLPVAVLVPPRSTPRRDVAEVMAEMDALRRDIGPFYDITIREMIEDGHRF